MVKSYNQDCPVARALDIVGERWTLLVLRDLFLHGKRRFTDFLHASPEISPNTLSARLKHLERTGIIEYDLYQEHPPRFEYSLTQKGQTLGPLLRALRNWGREQA